MLDKDGYPGTQAQRCAVFIVIISMAVSTTLQRGLRCINRDIIRHIVLYTGVVSAMQRLPRIRMTRCAVTANTKGLADCRAYKSTVSIMTAGATGMRICGTAYKGIIMTSCT